MAFGIIWKPNPYFPPNTWVEYTEDGFQKAVMEKTENGVRFVRNEGVIYPKETIWPFVLMVQKKGLGKH